MYSGPGLSFRLDTMCCIFRSDDRSKRDTGGRFTEGVGFD